MQIFLSFYNRWRGGYETKTLKTGHADGGGGGHKEITIFVSRNGQSCPSTCSIVLTISLILSTSPTASRHLPQFFCTHSLRTDRFLAHCTPGHPLHCPWGEKTQDQSLCNNHGEEISIAVLRIRKLSKSVRSLVLITMWEIHILFLH